MHPHDSGDMLSASSALSTEMRGGGRRRLLWLLGILLTPPLLLAILCLGLYFRANDSRVSSAVLETWPVVQDATRNNGTDLILWRGDYYLVHASALVPSGEDSRLRLWISKDSRQWKLVREFHLPGGEGLSAPKFAPIAHRLFIYALQCDAEGRPLGTQYTYSEGGQSWQPLRGTGPEGWLIGRPRSQDNRVWYAPAHWRGQGKAILLSSRNGIQWNEIGIIDEGHRIAEGDITFLPDGRLLACARLDESDSAYGDPEARTLIATAEAPYDRWSRTYSYVTRLDTPCLFTWRGQAYALGRHNPDPPRPLNYHGSILGRKRTALYRVSPDGMDWVSDLPSGGDTGHAGAVVLGGEVFVSYSTSDRRYDWPWLIGTRRPTEIHMARLRPDAAQ
jgi:hypothetical protein